MDGQLSAAAKHERKIAKLWRILRPKKTDTDVPPMLRLTALQRLLQYGEITSVEPLLPLFFTLRGKPYELTDHSVFSPMFRLTIPKRAVYRTARQVGKTTDVAASALVKANCIPNFVNLFVCPLFEQTRRLSGNFIRTFIDQSPMRALWTDTTTEKSVLQKSFTNNSKLIFSFAWLDADRVRGVSGDCLSIDEVQDMREEHIPVIREALAASPYAIEQFTGTPKSLGNILEKLSMQSSQAEWFIKCTHCSFYNIPSREFHLEKMIGPMRDDISEERPGVICAKCRQPISPRFGCWVHRYPELMHEFAGYHIPQIIMPLHYASPRKWAELCLKQRGGVQTSPATFWNEVLGESYDTGSRLLTLSELQAAACLPWENDYRDPDKVLRAVKEARIGYKETVLAIDWGGGGEERVSFTTVALLGYRGRGRVDIIWGTRLLTPNDHLEEAARVAYYIKKFRPAFIAHDATGAGKLRETILLQTGKIPKDKILAFELTGGGKALVKYVPPEPNRPRAVYRIDKTRTLQYTLASIRMQIIRSFKYDRKSDSDPGLLWDFLALIEEKTDTKYAGDLYSICREAGQSDDFAQAVNIGCVAMWHRHADWPDLYKTAGNKKHALAIAERLRNAVELTDEQLRAAGHSEYGWEEVDD